MATPRRAVLFDFGGVLTTSVLGSLRAFGSELGRPQLPLRLLAGGTTGGDLLVRIEEGRCSQAAFEDGFAALLRDHGADVAPDGLIDRMMAGVRPDPAMIDLAASLRGRGYRVGLLSNSLGDDSYRGFDLPAMFDSVTISSEIGVRKPSRRAFLAACDMLGVVPEETVMVDDLEQNVVAAGRLGMGGVEHRDAATTARELADLLAPEVPA